MKNMTKKLLSALALSSSLSFLSAAPKAFIHWEDLSQQSQQMMDMLGVIGRQAEDEKMGLVAAALELGRELLADRKAYEESKDEVGFLASVGTEENKERMMTLSTLASMVGPFVEDAFEISTQINLATYGKEKPLLQRLADYVDEQQLERDLLAAIGQTESALQITEQVAALVDALINNSPRALRAGLTVYYARKAGKQGTKMQLAKDVEAKRKVDELFAPLS